MYTMPGFHVRRKYHVNFHSLVATSMLSFGKDSVYTNAFIEGISLSS
jgi:hypothetical protein